MISLPYWLPALFALVTAAAGYALNRRYFFGVAREYQRLRSLRAFSDDFRGNAIGRIEGLPMIFKDELDQSDLREALDALTSYAIEINPSWILGVSPGGRLLSVALTERLGLPRDRCLYVGGASSEDEHFRFDPLPKKRVEGCMLVVDDAQRSGDTLRRLKYVLRSLNFDSVFRLSSVRFAVLVLADDRAEDLRFIPSWAWARTQSPSIRLPWSGKTVKVDDAYKAKDKTAAQKREIEKYEKVTRDYPEALAQAKQAFGKDFLDNYQVRYAQA